MKEIVTNNLFNDLKALKGVITFCFLIFMLAKPVASFIFDIADIEYELYESCEEKESEEKENISDSEDEDQKHNHYISDFEFHSNYKSSLFALHKNLISFHFEIPFPPPDMG